MIETTCLHWKDQYFAQGEKKGEKRGEKKGRQKERETIARNLVGMNMNEDQIIRATGLSREDVQRVTAEVPAPVH